MAPGHRGYHSYHCHEIVGTSALLHRKCRQNPADLYDFHRGRPAVGRLRGNLNLGLFFGLMYLSIIGFSVDLVSFFGSTMTITLFCFCVIVGSIALHLFLSRLFKVPYEYVILGITGAIADGTTASLVASSAKWNRLVSVGLIMGVIGGVCGNYVGIMVAYLIKFFIGA